MTDVTMTGLLERVGVEDTVANGWTLNLPKVERKYKGRHVKAEDPRWAVWSLGVGLSLMWVGGIVGASRFFLAVLEKTLG